MPLLIKLLGYGVVPAQDMYIVWVLGFWWEQLSLDELTDEHSRLSHSERIVGGHYISKKPPFGFGAMFEFCFDVEDVIL